MRVLVAVLIVVPLVAITWFAYQKYFAEGFDGKQLASQLLRKVPSISSEPEMVEAQAAGSPSGAVDAEGGYVEGARGNVSFFSEQDLLRSANKVGLDKFKSKPDQTGRLNEGEVPRQADRTAQAQVLVKRLKKLESL